MKKLFTLVLAILFASNSYTQDLGEFNPSFGTDGLYVFDPSASHDRMEKLIVQKDGKILTVGGARVGGENYSIYVSRHNTDGTLDETYGENGIAFFKVDPLIYMNYAFDAVLNDDGYLFVTGYTFDYENNTAFIISLDENGIENTDFGNNGYVVSEYGNGIDYEAIDIDSKGRPVVAGYSNDQILVRRFDTSGNPDTTFGNNGSTTIILDPTQWAYCYAYDVKILDDDKILVAGHKVSDMINNSYILRLMSDGTLDASFADNGVLYLNAGEYIEYAVSINIQADGKYLVGGHADSQTSTSKAFIARVLPEGTLDKTFGTEGFVTFEPFEGEKCTNLSYSILSTQDEQIFGTIYSYNNTTGASRAYVYNLDANGQFKEDFAGSGIMALPKLDENEKVIYTTSLALLDNKNLLVGGYIAMDATTQKLFIASINVDVVKDEEPENPGDGINELNSSLNIYPNPINDRLFIETEVEIKEIAIYTITGVLVGQQTTDNRQQTLSIDVTNLNSGVYFVKVVTNEGEVVKRIVKK